MEITENRFYRFYKSKDKNELAVEFEKLFGRKPDPALDFWTDADVRYQWNYGFTVKL